MKRLIQCSASILFVLSVLTVYVVFDYAVTSAVPKKNKQQATKTSESLLSLSNMNGFNNQTNKQSLMMKSERFVRNSKMKNNRPKPGPFHKSKTGIKINQIKRPNKQQQQQQQRKLLLTTKSSSRKTVQIPS